MKTRRILALVLALTLVFALAATAYAATDDSGTFIPDPNNPGVVNPLPNNPAPSRPSLDPSYNPAPFVPFDPAPNNPAPEAPADPVEPEISLPATGDASFTAIWLCLTLAAACCAIVLIKRTAR
ncbi:MAG: hypothetical protein IJC67_01955 [Clostridia bacterium]|nr:hypothetical protein [Clostridia bacterium]